MKTTSKMTAALLAAALGAALCACGQGGSAAGELRMLGPGDIHGRYCVADGPSSLVLCWMDYDSVRETPVCSAPNCQHDSEACTACMMEGGLSGLAVAGEELLVFVQSSQTGQQPSRLMACRRDGSERYLIAEMKNGDDIRGAPCCADAGYLYFHRLKMGGEHHVLARVPLAGGEVEELLTFENDDCLVAAAGGRRLMLLEHDWETPAYSATVFDVDSGDRQKYEVPFIDGNRPCDFLVSQGERMYVCQADGVHWLDMSGQEGFVPVEWPQSIQAYQPNCDYRAESMIGDQLLVSVGWCSGDQAPSLAQRFAVNLETGELQQAPLEYMNSKDLRIPVDVLGQSQDSLLVKFETQLQEDTFLQLNGVPAQGVMEVCRYGMISREDYLAGNVNYREFSVSYDSYWM